MEIGKTYLMYYQYDGSSPYEMKVLDISDNKEYFKYQRTTTSHSLVPMESAWAKIKDWIVIQEMA